MISFLSRSVSFSPFFGFSFHDYFLHNFQSHEEIFSEYTKVFTLYIFDNNGITLSYSKRQLYIPRSENLIDL